MVRYLSLFLLVWSALGDVFAQETHKTNSPYELYLNAVELYEREQYSAARIEFEGFLQQNLNSNDPYVIKAFYYRGMAALNLFSDDAVSLLSEFNTHYPENVYINDISLEVGHYFFQKENYSEALLYYNEVDKSLLDSMEFEKICFKKGYSYFQENNPKEAVGEFKYVKDSKGQYGIISLYYYAHLNYILGNYQQAMPGFQHLRSDPDFATIAPYYILQMYHYQGAYDSIVSYAPSVLDSSDLGNYNDVLHLLGNAHYQLKNYQEAATFLSQYNQRVKTTREEDYQLGFCYLKSNQWDKALGYLERSSRIDDSLGQISLYQIGLCYQNQDKLLPARNAFEKASNRKIHAAIREDALYQFAVISYKIDINPYDESVRAFEKYLELYPNSPRKNDIYKYLINVYASTSNYERALTSLNKIPNKDAHLKSVYQTVAYNYGVALYQSGNLDSSFNVMSFVDKYSEEPELIAKSRFWRAEILHSKQKYKAAIVEFKKFLGTPSANLLEEKNEAYYSMAYAYLELDQLSDALEYFGLYYQSPTKNSEKQLDALFQLADGHYQQGNDEQAILYYKTIAAKNSDLNDRCLFYLAKAYGYNKQPALKIATLEKIIQQYPKSKYLQNTTYELGMSYKAESNFDRAYDYFKGFITQFPKSPKVISCQIEIADIYYKQWKYDLSESSYKSILLEHSNKREICAVAAKGLMDVYVAMKNPSKAEEVANEYDCAGLSADDKENLYFNPALQNYVDSNFVDAAEKFEQYLTKFPAGKFHQDAQFYLGNSYLKLKDTVRAMDQYMAYLSGPLTGFFEPISLRVASYFYDKDNYPQAKTYYLKLEQCASKPNNITAAKLGVMRSSFLVKEYAMSKTYAEQVVALPGISNNLKLEAQYALGISAYHIGDFLGAEPALRWVVKNTTTVKAAESKYCLADIQFKNSKLDSSFVLIKELVKMKPTYNYWVAKGLILQTKIHVLQEQYLEADQTISSVINFYPTKEQDGVLDEAKSLKKEIDGYLNPEKNLQNDPQKTIEIKPE